MTVTMAARGYPESYRKGTEIRGLERSAALPNVTILHAGRTHGADGRILASGGRMLNVTASGRTLSEAKASIYAAVDLTDWPDGLCRRDIGRRTIAG